MNTILKYLKRYRKESILSPLLKCCEACIDLIVPLIIARIIDIGIVNSDGAYIQKQFYYLLILAIFGLAIAAIAQWFSSIAATGVAADMRHDMFAKVQSLSNKQLDTVGTDTLITRLTSDVNQVQNGVNLALRLLLRSPFIVFGSMIMAFTINVQCGLIFLAIIPILLAVVFTIMLKTIPMYRNVQSSLDTITEKTRENLAGVRVIRAFCREDGEVADFDAANEAYTKISEKTGRVSALLNPLTYLLINAATVVLIQRGAVQVQLGSLNQGQVVALYNYMAQIIVELIKLANLMITINRALACADRIQSVLSMENDQTLESEKNIPEQGVVFDNVSFSYYGANVLNDISFRANPGETVGVIGGTGSGKSTLVNLIPRFYDATGGTVYVDGRNVQSESVAELVDKCGIVPQKSVLFKGTIRDNLQWGNPQADDAAMEEALHIAQAAEVVEGKGGLNAPVEQGGRNFSGGQRQRLCIARALVRKPEILILDDSTSALDFATDAALRKAISEASRTMTVFIVSQRIASIASADHILVLDNGNLAGDGTHEELLKNCQVYREIYHSQYPEKSMEVLA